MKKRTIRLIIILGAISMAGIIMIQVYWVKQAYNSREKQFDQLIQIALKNVAEIIAEYNNVVLPPGNPVHKINSSYYIVNAHTFIHANILENYLKKEFDYYNIHLDYEYAIYDCTKDEMIYEKCISQNHDTCYNRLHFFPKTNKYTYYFGIYFPFKSKFLVGSMSIWFFFTFILLLVIGFFVYAVFIILKQKRLSEIQKDFIDNMTHEFKTPISSIAISSDVISQPSIIENPQKLFNYAAIIKGENERLKNQVEKVLQMANIEKKIQLKKEQIDLHILIDDIISKFKANNIKNGGEIRCMLDATNPIITADRLHMTNIIYNLLDNAIKYTEQTPSIVIGTENIKDGIILSVKDNGIGISKEYQKKVFDKFFRVPTGNVHNVKGFGLGLNYVKNIIKAHEWKIKLNSEPGKGSTFILSIKNKNYE